MHSSPCLAPDTDGTDVGVILTKQGVVQDTAADRTVGESPEVLRAHAALAARVRAYDDALAAALLGTLVTLLRAETPPAVLALYAHGCRLACFDAAPAPVAQPPAPAPGVVAELLARVDDLEDAADVQERVDALLNAAALRRAAAAVAHAARIAAG